MTVRRLTGVTLLILTAIFANGCFLVAGAVGVGAGAVWYYGALRSTEETSHTKLFDASKAAVGELGMTVTEDAVDATEGKIEATTGEDRRVAISIRRVTENTSELVIRVGIADEAGARELYAKIKEKLPGVVGSAGE